MHGINFERIGLMVAIAGLGISIWVAIDQGAKTRAAMFETRVQSRISTCLALAEQYGVQSWQYSAIPPEDFSKYSLPANTPYYDREDAKGSLDKTRERQTSAKGLVDRIRSSDPMRKKTAQNVLR